MTDSGGGGIPQPVPQWEKEDIHQLSLTRGALLTPLSTHPPTEGQIAPENITFAMRSTYAQGYKKDDTKLDQKIHVPCLYLCRPLSTSSGSSTVSPVYKIHRQSAKSESHSIQ